MLRASLEILLQTLVVGFLFYFMSFITSLSWWAFSIPQTKIFKSLQYTYRQIKHLTKESF